jgi:hypothetical protein
VRSKSEEWREVTEGSRTKYALAKIIFDGECRKKQSRIVNTELREMSGVNISHPLLFNDFVCPVDERERE